MQGRGPHLTKLPVDGQNALSDSHTVSGPNLSSACLWDSLLCPLQAPTGKSSYALGGDPLPSTWGGGQKTRRHRQLWLWFVGWTTSSGPSRFSPQVRMLRGVGRIPEFQAFSPPRTKVQEAEVLRHLGLKSQAQLSHGGKGSDDFIPARAPVRPLPPAACQPVSLRVVNRPSGI